MRIRCGISNGSVMGHGAQAEIAFRVSGFCVDRREFRISTRRRWTSGPRLSGYHHAQGEVGLFTLPNQIHQQLETVRRARRPYLAGANPARQLSLQPVAVGAAEGGNDLG